MLTQELIDYVKQQLKQGVSKETIAKNLSPQGWDQKDLQEFFLAIHNSYASASLVFGLVGVFSLISPFILSMFVVVFALNDTFGVIGSLGYILFNVVSIISAVAGFYCGLRGSKSLKRWKAVSGIILSVIVIFIWLVAKWFTSLL